MSKPQDDRWYDQLTIQEAREIEVLDRALSSARDTVRALMERRELIRNRVAGRRRTMADNARRVVAGPPEGIGVSADGRLVGTQGIVLDGD